MANSPEYLEITYSEEAFLEDNASRLYGILPFANSELYCGDVTSAQLLTNGNDVKAVYDIGIDTKNVGYEYNPGDTIGIFGENSQEEVSKLMERLNLTKWCDKTYNLSILPNTAKKRAAIPNHIPAKSTLRRVFLRNLDIRSVPKKLFLRVLSEHTTCGNEIEKMQFMSSPSGSNEYNEFINGVGRTLSGILGTFSTCQPPITRLLENLPALRPRPYSIASSPLNNKELHFAVSVLDDMNKGVCSGWLEKRCKTIDCDTATKLKELNINGTSEKFSIPFYFRKSNSFRLPDNPMTPIIMVGPGTGIAPFVGFLQHRRHQKMGETRIGGAWLFFGCRYSQRDFLYKDELMNYLAEGVLTKLFTSFSRESASKPYVQDNILKNGEELVRLLLEHNAVLYVCGEAKSMRQDVKNTVVQCLINFTLKDPKESEELVASWQKSNKYIEDIWI